MVVRKTTSYQLWWKKEENGMFLRFPHIMNLQRHPSRDKRFVGTFIQHRRSSPRQVYDLIHMLSGAQGKTLPSA